MLDPKAMEKQFMNVVVINPRTREEIPYEVWLRGGKPWKIPGETVKRRVEIAGRETPEQVNEGEISLGDVQWKPLDIDEKKEEEVKDEVEKKREEIAGQETQVKGSPGGVPFEQPSEEACLETDNVAKEPIDTKKEQEVEAPKKAETLEEEGLETTALEEAHVPRLNETNSQENAREPDKQEEEIEAPRSNAPVQPDQQNDRDEIEDSKEPLNNQEQDKETENVPNAFKSSPNEPKQEELQEDERINVDQPEESSPKNGTKETPDSELNKIEDDVEQEADAVELSEDSKAQEEPTPESGDVSNPEEASKDKSTIVDEGFELVDKEEVESEPKIESEEAQRATTKEIEQEIHEPIAENVAETGANASTPTEREKPEDNKAESDEELDATLVE